MSPADGTLPNQDTLAAPARAVANGGGRLGVLAEITATLDESPETPEALESVVHGALTATASDAVHLHILSYAGSDSIVAEAGSDVAPGGPCLQILLATSLGPLGEFTVTRAPGRDTFSDSDALFARTVATHVSHAIEEHRAKRTPARSKSRPVRSFFPGRKKT